MEKQLIISIGREFGSGGHEIAEILAKRFDIPLYDFNLLRDIANEKGVHVSNLEKYDEVPRKGFSKTVRGYNNSPQVNIAYMQFDFLRKKANEGESFVVVGRCSEEVLKGTPGLITMFILGDEDKKLERIMRIHGLNEKAGKELLRRQNKKRRDYHNFFCDSNWGDSRNYEVSINSSKLGEEETANMLEKYIRARYEQF